MNTTEGVNKTERRRKAILHWLKQRGSITVAEIVENFHCSEATARRDLDMLHKTEPVIRTIGGAMYDGYTSMKEATFAEKTNLLWIEKENIANKAASYVEPGDIIGLSGGTTTYLIARALKQHAGITVVTNAVNIAMELADCEEIQVVVTGGIMRNKSFELCGPLAETMIGQIHIGKMFLGIDGIDVEHGLTTYSEAEAQIAKALIRRSQSTYAVFDHTKVNKASLFSIAPLAEIHGLITDREPDGKLQKAIAEHNIQVFCHHN